MAPRFRIEGSIPQEVAGSGDICSVAGIGNNSNFGPARLDTRLSERHKALEIYAEGHRTEPLLLEENVNFTEPRANAQEFR